MPEVFFEDRDNAIIEDEWNALHCHIKPAVRQKLAEIVRTAGPHLIARFQAAFRNEAALSELLSEEMFQAQVFLPLRNWLTELFPPDHAPDFRRMVEHQLAASSALARINMPIQHVSKALRILVDGVRSEIVEAEDNKEHMIAMLNLSFGTFDIALEIVKAGYNRAFTRAARNEEAYRLFALGQNLAEEREAQRAAIAEWTQNILFSVVAGFDDQQQTPLWESEFGLWLTHRGNVIFEGMAELKQVGATIDNIDNHILPMLGDKQKLMTYLSMLQAKISVIKSLLGECFNTATRIEGGHDPLTRMLNRRFMDTVLSREVILARKKQKGLTLLMVDLDHFKTINDKHGHTGGDTVLQQCATRILECVRLSDFVFRYGGEEFLVVLTETTGNSALITAERLLKTISNEAILLPNEQTVHLSASIGVAEYNGHPDYLKLVKSADNALYQAKLNGRNQYFKA